MRAWIISDLHLEFGQRFDLAVPSDADVAIVAGDITVKGIVPTLQWIANTIAPRLPVIVVAGNHEFYGAAMVTSIEDARAFAKEVVNIHFLENDTVTLGGVTFVGGTLWTDFKLGDRDPEVTMYTAAHGSGGHRMSDYKHIKYTKIPFRKFKPIQAYRKHVETRDYIASELRVHPKRRTVIVTHHAPSIRSIDWKDRDDPLAPCYASALDALIMETQPVMWVHGHIHKRVEYHIGMTKIIANPRGYPGERSSFEPDLTVDI